MSTLIVTNLVRVWTVTVQVQWSSVACEIAGIDFKLGVKRKLTITPPIVGRVSESNDTALYLVYRTQHHQ